VKTRTFILQSALAIICACSRSEEPQTSGILSVICTKPTDLTILSLTASSVSLSWSPSSNAVSYDVEYKKDTAGDWISATARTTARAVDLDNLSPSTVYDWRVKTNCNTGSSDFSESTFTTSFGRERLNGLAANYPGDANIQNDPAVLFVEQFSDGLPNIFNRYDDKLNKEGMSLDTDVPQGSAVSGSIKMTSITNGVTGGGHLFKMFAPGFDSVVYLRYYVKYPSESKNYFHHESVWFGGYNPATSWPDPRAGNCGLGDSRLSIAFEPVWQDTDPPGLDTYVYWGDMKSWNGGSSCFGNTMISEGATAYGQPRSSGNYPTVTFGQWMCVEIMLKLNNPVTEYNGELAVWVNGVQAGHWGPGSPKGHWEKDKWYNNPNDPPFQGFRWRTNAGVNINWLWLEYFHENPKAPSSYIKFSNLVMATKYIGPIKR
jgi:hypothetical protein